MVCNGERNIQTFRVNQMNSMMEGVNCVCHDVLDDHEWVSELSVAFRKRKVRKLWNYDFDIPCIVQCGMLWFSSPTSLNKDMLNDGVIF